MQETIFKITDVIFSKTRDFRYAALFFSLILIADTLSSVTLNKTLLEINLNDFGGVIKLSGLMVYIAISLFYFSLFVTFVFEIIKAISILVPYSVSNALGLTRELSARKDRSHFLYDIKMESYAIKNNNEVAYMAFREYLKKKKENESLGFNCLALCIISIINFYFCSNVKSSISNILLDLVLESNYMVIFSLAIVSIYAFYCGVVVHCGFEYRNRDYVRFYEHGLNEEKAS